MKHHNAGVYALTHVATRQIYIGSSKNFKHRRQKWWQKMSRDPQNLPPVMRAMTKSRHDWKFSVVWDGTGATSEQLQQYEKQALEILRRRAPERVLNIVPVQRPDNTGLTVRTPQGVRTLSLNAWSRETGIPRATISLRVKQLGWTPEQSVGLSPPPVRDYRNDARRFGLSVMRTVVLDDDGKPLLTSEASRLLGCGYNALSERLRRRRVRYGETKVTLAELKLLSDKYRPRQRGAL